MNRPAAQLERLPLLAALSSQQRSELLARSRESVLERSQMLFMRGDPAEHFFLVLEGWIRVYRETPEGHETVLHIVPAGESFAEPAALNLGRYPASAQAASPARVLAIPADVFIAFMRETPDLAIRTIGLLAQRMRRLVADFDHLQTRSTPQRLAHFLLELVEPGARRAEIALPYDKHLIAARLGMSPETLSRSLAKLRRLGVSGERHRVTIEDVAALRRFVDDA